MDSRCHSGSQVEQINARMRSWLRYVRLTCLAAVLVCLIAYREKSGVPSREALVPEVASAPEQHAEQLTPFEFRYEGETYVIEPTASYDISGIVVSQNNIHSLSDIYHDRHSVDFKDLCLAWGDNSDPDLLTQVKFHSEPWSCQYRIAAPDVARRFNPSAFSNNHLLAGDAAVRDVVNRLEVGDQVRLAGLLVNYYPLGHPESRRKTSQTRRDRGNQACEILFLTSATLLVPYHAHAAAAFRVAGSLAAVTAVLWIIFLVVQPYLDLRVSNWLAPRLKSGSGCTMVPRQSTM